MGIKVVALAKRERKKNHNLSVDRSDCVLELKSSQRFVCACVFEFLCAVNGHLVRLTVCFLRKKTKNKTLTPSHRSQVPQCTLFIFIQKFESLVT